MRKIIIMNWKDCGGRFKAGEAGMEASASRLCSAWRKWGRRICVHTMPFFWMWNCPGRTDSLLRRSCAVRAVRRISCLLRTIRSFRSRAIQCTHRTISSSPWSRNASTLQWIISPGIAVSKSAGASCCSAVFPSRTDTSSQKYYMWRQATTAASFIHTIKRKAMRSHSRRWKNSCRQRILKSVTAAISSTFMR